MSSTCINKPYVTWKLLSPAGPAVAYHVGCIVKNKLYIHGGIANKKDAQPRNNLFLFDLENNMWNEVRAAGSPALSHHTATVLHDRYILLVGGWDGHRRLCTAHAYDTVDRQWTALQTSGFPEGGGLSSHTLTPLVDGSLLVIGREGSLRTQRRTGNAFVLAVDLAGKRAVYTERSCAVSSRSGHSTHALGNGIYIYGGRADSGFEQHAGVKEGLRAARLRNNTLLALRESARTVPALSKVPCGRKQHAAVSDNDVIVIHGGDTFDGRSREPVGDLYLVEVRPHVTWRPLTSHEVIPRAGHVMVADSERVVMHGGAGAKGVVYGDSYQLTPL